MGEYQHNLDSKGRLIIPAKFRTELEDHFVITRGMDGCLFGYTMTQWQVIQDKINALPVSKKDVRAFTRFFFSAAMIGQLDKQGRVNLPQSLIEYAHLTKECVIVGVSNRFEIWDRNQWVQVTDNVAKDFEAIAENVIDF